SLPHIRGITSESQKDGMDRLWHEAYRLCIRGCSHCDGRSKCYVYLLSATTGITMVLHRIGVNCLRCLDGSIWGIYSSCKLAKAQQWTAFANFIILCNRCLCSLILRQCSSRH